MEVIADTSACIEWPEEQIINRIDRLTFDRVKAGVEETRRQQAAREINYLVFELACRNTEEL